MNSEIVRVVLIVVISYLLGSIPTGYLVGRLRNVNIFEVGSGNMGATNIVRATGGIGWGALVWFFDSTKGMIAMLIAARLMPENTVTAMVLGAIVAVIGHNWSLFATIITGTIRGGKGAATAFGTLFLFVPLQLIAVMLLLCGFIIALTRYVSLGVLMMFAVAAIWILVMVSQHLPG